jgi:hypothetical protein
MATCDRCNANVFGGKRYGAAAIRQAVRNGLRLPESEYRLGAVGGRTTQQVHDDWVRFVMSDSSDWLLCPACSGVVDRHA